MELRILRQVEAILADDRLEDEATDDSKCERIEGLIPEAGWEAVLTSVLGILSAERRVADYRVAAEVLWGAVLDRRDVPADRVIALLYHRLDPGGDDEDDLVWSITSRLKGVGYLSEYEPLRDPAVARELEALREG